MAGRLWQAGGVATPDRSALETQLLESLAELAAVPVVDPGGSSSALAELERLFDVQLASRFCDLAARWLRGQGKGYYTIGSSGHESNAAVAMSLRPTDPALLHYRSGGFYLARAGLGGVHDILAGMVAATDEPKVNVQGVARIDAASEARSAAFR